MRKTHVINTLLLSIILVNFASAKVFDHEAKIQTYFEILSHEDTDFEPMGEVCERVALHEIEPLYPLTQYRYVNSVEYAEKGMTIGELDLVIFDKATDDVVAIGEVKCWKDMSNALEKAHEQRNRFKTRVNRNIVLTDIDGKIIPRSKFLNVQKYFSLAPLGGVDYGFDLEMSLDFKDLMELRKRLLDCHSTGKCPVK